MRRLGTRWQGTPESLGNDLAELPELSLDALKARWRDLFGAPPPSRLGRSLMVRGIAYRMQEQALGGLRPATHRRIARAFANIVDGRVLSSNQPTIKPGTRLLREWQGVTHEVIILESGVQYRDAVWPSLSAVAREITGTRWSGPRFFGIRGRNHERR